MEKTVKELEEFYNEYSTQTFRKQAVQEALKLVDLKKTEMRTFSAFNKGQLRKFFKNPKANEKKIIELSQFLYRLSHQYRREIKYRAQMLDLTAYTVIPDLDITKKHNLQKIKKQYQKTIRQLQKLNMPFQIEKMATIAWKEDACYGYVYEDDKGFFIMPLPGDFCKISSQNYDGTYNFAFDFSYFRTRTQLLEYWGEEFKEKYNQYSLDGSLRWMELNRDKTFCLKINTDDSTMIFPPLAALFEQLIDLIDQQSIQSVKDELSIYKLLVARLELMPNAKHPDEFNLDVDTAIDYYNRLSASLPECVSSCISPMKIDAIEFKGTTTEDNDMISKSMSNLFKASGSSKVLDGDKISGSLGTFASILSDSLEVTGDLLGQIEAWVNRYLTHSLGNHDKIKYLRVTPYTKKDMIKEFKEAGQYGVPVKLAYAALLGLNPLEVTAMSTLENECFDIHNSWIPLNSTHTQSGSSEKDIEDLTDEGLATRDQDKNNMR